MTFQIIDVPQRSIEWFAARAGRLTGSAAGDMLATIKSGEAAARRNLRTKLVVERLTGNPEEGGFVSPAMQWGIEKEADAFAAYEAHTGNMVRRTGFLSANDVMAGCSLDGDVENFAGIVELKCPLSSTHLSYIKSGGVPANHLPQLLHNLWISGAQWCDFVSFDPRFPPHLQLFICRVPRVEMEVRSYGGAAERFLAEVDAELDGLSALRVAVA